MSTNIPSIETARPLWEEARAEDAFWSQHLRELLRRYPDQFVAVANGMVVATSPSLGDLINELQRREIDIGRVWLRFMATDSRRFML